MAEETKQAEKAAADARQEAVNAERKRAADIKAAFPEDSEFAVEQIASGASLAEAKAAYADVVIKRNKTLAEENEKLKKEAADAAVSNDTDGEGGDLLENENEGGKAEDKVTFFSRSKELAAEKGWSFQKASKFVAKHQPELYEKQQKALGAAR